MTREEAKEVIKAYYDKLTNSVSNQLDGDIKAFEMAIEALKAINDIKAEIEELPFDHYFNKKRILEIIDKHIGKEN